MSENLYSVQETCQKLEIGFLGIHYNAVQHNLQKKFINLDIATLQFNILEKEKKWISDTEAEEVLTYCNKP